MTLYAYLVTSKVNLPNTATELLPPVFQITPGSEGLPVNVQCVGLPFQEELVLRLMKEIELGLKK